MSERAEAARGAFYQARWEQKKPLDPIRFGVEWADDSPRPCTITADQCNDIEDAVHEGVPLGHMLRRLGIEVRDE